jgi:Ca2+-binding RTX toxin-like protein
MRFLNLSMNPMQHFVNDKERTMATYYGTTGSNYLYASRTENSDDIMYGYEGWDLLYGYGGNDLLYGGDDRDDLYGGQGADTMYGGSGSDYYYVMDSDDVVIEEPNSGASDVIYTTVSYVLPENVERMVLYVDGIEGYGNAAANRISSNYENCSIFGYDGNDTLTSSYVGDTTLFGGEGNDQMISNSAEATLYGGTGNDVYYQWTAGTVVEFANEGNDVIYAYTDYTLPENVEVLRLESASGRVNGYGNAGDNSITGNHMINKLYGYNGNDTLDGWAGNDLVYGGDGNDLLTDSWSGHDKLYGEDGNDTLDGGLGYDSMYGGAGDDLYYVNSVYDVTQDVVNGGTDTVIAESKYTLGAYIENLVMIDYWDQNGVGNSLDNGMTGNSYKNVMYSGSGNDVIDGLAGNDSLYGENGNDALYGGEGNDTVHGGYGQDVLDGGVGADSMNGGYNNDVYYVDDTGDKTVEISAGGSGDQVYSSVSFNIAEWYVEYLTLTGTGNINATANGLNNTVVGNSGDNIIYGAKGQDVLTGNGGSDTFVFKAYNESATSAMDRITDFGTDDKLDFSAFDAKYSVSGSQDFTFIGTDAFTKGVAGQLRFEYNAATGNGVLSANIDGDVTAEFAIELAGVTSLSADAVIV